MITSLVVVLSVSLILIAISFFVFREFGNAQVSEAKNYLSEITLQYKNTITKQINGDLQTLQALATFIGQQPDYSLDQIMEDLRKENDRNKFFRMGFVTADGIGYFVGLNGQAIEGGDVSDEPFIKEALDGVPSISDTMKDVYSEFYINCYAVPIYSGNEMIGVLTATNKAEEFGELLDQSLFQGKGYIHIVNRDGDFVIKSDREKKEAEENIFASDYLGEIDENAVKKSLKSGKNEFIKTEFGGQTCWTSFRHLDVNDWYLLCIVPESAMNSTFVRLSHIFELVLVCIILMFLALFIYIYRINKKSRKSIERLAYYDALTGAYNKNKFWEEAGQLLKEERGYALVIFDVANFKLVNELFGYDKGDSLLRYIAGICGDNIEDKELYYHDSADNFGMLMRFDNTEEFTKRIMSILQSISDCQLSEKQDYKVSCSCGIKIIDSFDVSEDLDSSYDRANMALKEAKGSRKNTIIYYGERLHEKARIRNEVESSMHSALEEREFIMYLQPKINLAAKKIVGAEALIRWIKKDGKMIYPDQFIPIFEQNGFIADVDIYMMEEACRKLRNWMDLGYEVVPISVNQSRILFYKQNYMLKLKELISRYRIDPAYIILEVTEGITMENIKEMKRVIREIHGMGFAVSMDDFGSGYSSLNILKDLEIDELKLDKVFLDETEDAKKRDQIMKNIIRMAQDLAISTVVEGIETEGQADFATEIGCEIGQGYYFAKPMPADKFVDMAYKKC